MASATREADEPERVLLLAAGSQRELVKSLAAPDSDLLADARIRQKPASGYRGCRIGIVDPTPKRLALARKIVASGRPWRGRNDIWFSPAPLLHDADHGVAFVFPGLEAEFAPRIEDVADWLGVAAPALSSSSIGPHAASVLAVGRLLTDALDALEVRPDAVVGHSVGEWAAMIVGGLVSGAEFDTLLANTDLDTLRVPGVQFAVLGAGINSVADDIDARPGVVVSHDNSTNQTVACGPDAEIAILIGNLRARGVICQILPFRSGFHTPMLRPYLAPFEAGVPSLRITRVSLPVWSATSARPFPCDARAVRRLCVRHLLQPVRFRATIQAMHAAGSRVFVQVGAGQLGSLIDDTLAGDDHLTIAANSTHRAGLGQLRRVITALWTEGAEPNFAALDRPPRNVPVLAGPVSAAASGDALARLRELGARLPAANEFCQLLGEVADSVAAVLGAAISAGTRPALPAPVAQDSSLLVSTREMPYLLDHCFVATRAGWPDEADRRPVVPATTILAHLLTAARRSAPGRQAIGVDELRLDRWLVAAPALEVTTRVRPVGSDRVRVSLDGYAEAVVLLDTHYPTDTSPAWPPAPDEAPTALSAAQLYAQRWLFHGPGFQSVCGSVGIAEDSIRGELTALATPGALVDGVGQLLGQWLVERHPDRWIAFPFRIDRIRQHAEQPPAGSRVDCTVRIRTLNVDTVVADAKLSCAGRPLMSIEGWHDHRFDSGPRATAVQRFPQHSTLSEQHDGGWWLLVESSPSLASREFYLHKYLSGGEHDEYAACPPRQRRGWLLRRIVIKDAVRGWLWTHGAGPLFPAEIAVRVDESGRYTVTGRHGLRLPALSVGVAQCRQLAVALVGEIGTGGRHRIRIAEIPAEPAGHHAADSIVAARLTTALRAETGASSLSRPRTETIRVPAGPAARRYVVAWTETTPTHQPKETAP